MSHAEPAPPLRPLARLPESKAARAVVLGLALAGPLLLGGVALAQKYPGPAVTPRAARPAAPAPFAEPMAPAAEPQANPAVEQQVAALPLDPATRELRDSLPADVPGIERQLGLREPRGPRTDLRGRTPSPREIADALAPR